LFGFCAIVSKYCRIFAAVKNSIHFDHVCLKPSEQIGIHQQPTWELSLVIEGEGIRTIADVSEPFKSGEVVLVPPDMSHCWLFNDNGKKIENITVIFAPELIHTVAATFPELQTHFEGLAESIKAVVFTGRTRQRLSEGLKQMTGLTDAERLTMFIHLLSIIAVSSDRREIGRAKEADTQRRLKQIEIYISCNYKRDVSIDDLAQHVGMNRSALCTFFKHHTGKTIITYLNEHRLFVACHLLRHTSLTIQQVCYESGFNDVPHFCRIFKKKEGITPKEYRG
jgi:AraC-like DNA-binding protein/quercetin dioxygenase-like cupin family protein